MPTSKDRVIEDLMDECVQREYSSEAIIDLLLGVMTAKQVSKAVNLVLDDE